MASNEHEMSYLNFTKLATKKSCYLSSQHVQDRVQTKNFGHALNIMKGFFMSSKKSPPDTMVIFFFKLLFESIQCKYSVMPKINSILGHFEQFYSQILSRNHI